MNDKLIMKDGKPHKIAEVVMLPTINEDRIKTNIYKFIGTRRDIFDKRIKGNLALTASPDNKDYQCQHLYIVSSDEEIKENYKGFAVVTVKDDTRIKYLVEIIVTEKNQIYVKGDIKFTSEYYIWNKIIATTDKSLEIKTGEIIVGRYAVINSLPEPSDSFIKKFIESYNAGNPITEVLVEYETFQNMDVYKNKDNTKRDHVGDDGYVYNDYKLKVDKDNKISTFKIKDSWSREEVTNILYKHTEDMLSGYKDTLENWIEQNL